MSGVSQPNVLAILCSDIHLSHRPPIARSAEPDWYAAMARPLAELRALQEAYQCPIIFAGDLFDVWKSPPELINFALDHLPVMYGIPGQHDLPCHSYEDRHKSAYWTMVQAGKVIPINPNTPLELKEYGLRLHGFPWSFDVVPLTNKKVGFKDIAVVHSYIWSKQRNTGYPGALKDSCVPAWRRKLQGYDLAVFGDNHKSLLLQ